MRLSYFYNENTYIYKSACLYWSEVTGNQDNRLNHNDPHYDVQQIDGLVQERRNSIAIALGLRFSCTNPSICFPRMKRQPHL